MLMHEGDLLGLQKTELEKSRLHYSRRAKSDYLISFPCFDVG